MTIKTTLMSMTFASGIALSATAGFAETLTMSSWIPPVHPLVSEVLGPWADSIAEVTEGRVSVRILPKSVGSPPQQFETVSTGQVDIGYSNQAYTANRFKYYGYSELPRGGDDAVATSVAYWRTYSDLFETHNEMPEVKLLGVFTHGPGQIFTKEHAIAGLDGNENIKVRGGGISSTRVIDTLGMTSIQAPISKAAEMLGNGIANGIALEPSSVISFKFDKYVDNRFTVDGGLYNASFYVMMNLDKWNTLSAEDQAAIEAVSGEALARQAGEMWNRGTAGAEAAFEGLGLTTTMPEGEFAAKLDAAFDQYEADWIASVAKDGVDGAALLQSYRDEVAAVEAGN